MHLSELHTYAMLGAAVLAFALGGARDNGSQAPRVVGGLQILAGAAVVSMMHGWLDLPWDHVDGAIGIGAAALWVLALLKAEKPVAAFACSVIMLL